VSRDQEADLISYGRGYLNKNTFYESKREKGVFIQRREKRISSSGEKGEITFKGIMSSRKGKSKNKLFGVF